MTGGASSAPTHGLRLLFSEPPIRDDADRLGELLPADVEGDDVGAGVDRLTAAAAPSAATAAAATLIGSSRRIRREVPQHAVDAVLLRAVDRADYASVDVGDRDLHVTGRRGLQVVADIG